MAREVGFGISARCTDRRPRVRIDDPPGCVRWTVAPVRPLRRVRQSRLHQVARIASDRAAARASSWLRPPRTWSSVSPPPAPSRANPPTVPSPPPDHQRDRRVVWPPPLARRRARATRAISSLAMRTPQIAASPASWSLEMMTSSIPAACAASAADHRRVHVVQHDPVAMPRNAGSSGLGVSGASPRSTAARCSLRPLRQSRPDVGLPQGRDERRAGQRTGGEGPGVMMAAHRLVTSNTTRQWMRALAPASASPSRPPPHRVKRRRTAFMARTSMPLASSVVYSCVCRRS